MLILLLFACKNELKDIQAVSSMLDTMPGLSANNIEFYYSESGEVQLKLTGPVMKRYDGEKPYIEFPDGFQVQFFDSLKQVKTIITANYGINYEKARIMEARGDVVVINHETNEKLNTEELIWDQNKEKIFSNKFVKLTSEDNILYGEGLESDQTFRNRRIIKVTGQIMVEDDAPGDGAQDN